MLARGYQLYLLRRDGDSEYGISTDPLLDLRWAASHWGAVSLTTVSPPLPLWLAAYTLDRLKEHPVEERRALETVARTVRRWGRRLDFSPLTVEASHSLGVDLPGAEHVARLAGLMGGRGLLEEEVYRGLHSRGIASIGEVEPLLGIMVLSGLSRRLPAVEIEHLDRPRCNRCGERYRVVRADCPLCGGSCFLCLECASMGESRGCRALYLTEPAGVRQEPARPATVVLPYELTPAQRDAARTLSETLNGSGEALLWAVCGAGKTEVTFEAVAQAINRGERVLYTVPRRDVVNELAPRFRGAFKGQEVAVLPGDPRERMDRAAITLATTHQTMRFYHSYDLVILDEADAYPYAGSGMLRRAVGRARAPGGRLVYMTATPDPSLSERAAAGDLPVIRIPARHHGRPLAVPAVHQVRFEELRGEWRLPQLAGRFIDEALQRGARVLIFVPTVELAERVGRVIMCEARDRNVEAAFLHSRLGERDSIVARLKDGRIRLLVTTTLLERGITLPRTDVLVLYADHAVFDAGALIQMSGRAGRHADDPIGRVAFLQERRGESTQEAVETITAMNELASASGYLVDPAVS